MKQITNKPWLLLLLALIFYSCNKKVVKATLTDIPAHALTNEGDLDAILNEVGDARIVLLGEASHGTAEYYQWRTALTRRLIQEKGFNAIGVEGEWADSYRVNQFIQGPQKDSLQAVEMLRQYDRWPTWMWGNHEVASLVTWLNKTNNSRGAAQKVGFYGLDVYCIWEAAEDLAPLVQNNDTLRSLAQQVYNCFRPFSADPQEYATAIARSTANCRSAAERLWNGIYNATGSATARDEAAFLMQQNALVIKNGEQYYRTAVSDNAESWNIRDRHMEQTLRRLLEKGGPDSKIIVWAHNTHVGDARYTDMAASGMVNLGQLAREEFGEAAVYAVGFGSYEGSVIAADYWGGAIKSMQVPRAQPGSWEALLHGIGTNNRILLSSEIAETERLQKSIGHRAIGVVYNPSSERGNYVPSMMAKRYDAFIYIDRTTALHPLGTRPNNDPPDTYPFGY